MMFIRKSQKDKSEWSPDMLVKLRDTLLYGLSGIQFVVEQRGASVDITSRETRNHKNFRGRLTVAEELEDVVVSVAENANLVESNGTLGFFEILNGVEDDMTRKIPLIRGNLAPSFKLTEVIDKELIDRKILNHHLPVSVSFRIDVAILGDKDGNGMPPEQLLRTKLPITRFAVSSSIVL